MSSLSLDQARVIDPTLSAVAQGYKHADRVGSVLFPHVDVPTRAGKIIEFGRESFRIYSARRAPGASTLHVPFGYKGKPYFLVQDALNSGIPRELSEEAKAVPNIDLGKRAVTSCMYSLTLTLEAEQADLATNPDSYDNNRKITLSGSDCWDDTASNPLRIIDEAKEAVRTATGLDPNRAVISKPVFNALKNHPSIVERFKYTSSDSITPMMLAALFDLDMLAIGKAKALTGPDDSAVFEDVWGNCMVLAYVPPTSLGMEEPGFGYTYTLKGHPYVEKPYWDGDKKSWIYGVTYERNAILTGISSGFLITNVVGG